MKFTRKIVAFFILVLLAIPVLLSSKSFALEVQAVTVNMTYVFDKDNILETTPIENETYGDTVTVPVPTHPGYEFAFWIVNGVVKTNPSENTFRVTGDMNIQMIMKPTGQLAVVFIDSNGAFIDVEFTTSSGSVSAPTTTGISKPGLSVKETNTWKDSITGSFSLSSIMQDRVYVLQYETTSLSSYTITVVDGSIVTPAPITDPSDKYNYNQVVEVTAPSTKENVNFSHWEDEDGFRLSYNRNYKFTVASDKTLTAVYNDEIAEMPLVAMSDDLAVREGYRTYMGQFHVPAGYELVEYGFLISDLVTPIMKGDANVTTAQNNYYTAETNEYVMSFPEDSHTNARAYLTVKQTSSGDILTVHSNRNIIVESEGGLASDLFISEYIEGESNDKVIEIFNGTGVTVNLSTYTIKINANANTTWSAPITLSGNLNHGETYVIVNSSASSTVKAFADLESGSLSHNGDDAIGLFKNDVLIDIFGVFGEDPGTGWEVDGTLNATVDKTIVRKSASAIPKTTWDDTDWTVFNLNTYSFLGSHTFTPFGGIEYTSNLTFTYTPNINGTSNKTIYTGDTTYNPLTDISATDSTDSAMTINFELYLADILIVNPVFSELSAGTYKLIYSVTNSLSIEKLEEITLTVEDEPTIIEEVMNQTLTGTTGNPPSGWTYTGLGSAYADGSLKMDTTNDTIKTSTFALQTNATFSITVKGNSFSGGSLVFYDQNDNVLYTANTEIGNTSTIISFALSSSVTSVRWVYTKVTGNIGVYSVTINHNLE